MNPNFEELAAEIREAARGAATSEAAEQFRITYLGKKGKVSVLMERLRDLPPSERRDFGQKVNQIKQLAEGLLEAIRGSAGAEPASGDTFDDSLPSIRPASGAIHPISQTVREITRIFVRMGFDLVDGPEVETEFHNFTALNIPLDHSSREAFDTFYTESGHLLRSQTSTVQIRVMKSHKPPLRILAPGRVYRPDTVDASHSFMFHQIEGLYVDQRVTFADLKGALNLFIRELFGSKTRTRFRPHFFPFTEPSVEVDIEWGKKGWLEILGAGCVDPNVFQAVGYDPKKFRGWAFGMGVERIAMLRHGISDIRHFYENDLRFLRQFS